MFVVLVVLVGAVEASVVDAGRTGVGLVTGSDVVGSFGAGGRRVLAADGAGNAVAVGAADEVGPGCGDREQPRRQDAHAECELGDERGRCPP